MDPYCCKHLKNLSPTPLNDNVHQYKYVEGDDEVLQCEKCELTANLYFCLTCGFVGCGRSHLSNIRGNRHCLWHFEARRQCAVAMKIGTLQERSSDRPCALCDIWCYACEEFVGLPTYEEFETKVLKPFGIQGNSHLSDLTLSYRLTQLLTIILPKFRLCFTNFVVLILRIGFFGFVLTKRQSTRIQVCIYPNALDMPASTFLGIERQNMLPFSFEQRLDKDDHSKS